MSSGSCVWFQANFPKLYQQLDLDDGSLWSNFARSSHCEQEFPAAVEKRCTPFQQVLLVQAARPDRLQSSMGLFACRALGEGSPALCLVLFCLQLGKFVCVCRGACVCVCGEGGGDIS